MKLKLKNLFSKLNCFRPKPETIIFNASAQAEREDKIRLWSSHCPQPSPISHLPQPRTPNPKPIASAKGDKVIYTPADQAAREADIQRWLSYCPPATTSPPPTAPRPSPKAMPSCSASGIYTPSEDADRTTTIHTWLSSCLPTATSTSASHPSSPAANDSSTAITSPASLSSPSAQSSALTSLRPTPRRKPLPETYIPMPPHEILMRQSKGLEEARKATQALQSLCAERDLSNPDGGKSDTVGSSSFATFSSARDTDSEVREREAQCPCVKTGCGFVYTGRIYSDEEIEEMFGGWEGDGGEIALELVLG